MMTAFAKMHKFICSFVFIFIIIGTSSCQKINPTRAVTGDAAIILPTNTLDVPAVPRKKIVTQAVVSDWLMNSDLGENFGWLPDGRVYYGRRNKEKIDWFVYDPSNDMTSALEAPGPGLTPEAYQRITEGGKIAVTAFAASPSGDVVFYTRVPLDYTDPKTPEADHFDPQELWMFRKGEEPTLLAEEFAYDCGILAPWSDWFDNESMGLGTCLPYYGIESFFMADVAKHVIRYYDWVVTPDGQTDSIATASMAHASPQIAFKTYTLDELWVISLDNGQKEKMLDMRKATLLTKSDITAPLWSYDDQWIYYWRFGEVAAYDQSGSSKYFPWWLEKINVATGQATTVLSEADLRSAIGDQRYETYGGYQWRLSPDEHQILLLRDTTLLLISW